MPGREGVSTSTEPIFELAGQVIGLLVSLANWASVHGLRPLATEGLSPAPCGRVTLATLRLELIRPAGSGLKGMNMSTVAGSGESVLPLAEALTVGSKGTLSQPVAL